MPTPRQFVTSLDALRAIVPAPDSLVIDKTIDHLDDLCQRFIAAAPFVLLASRRPSGTMDVSPRGDPPGFVRVLDERTLAIPERPGNRRMDTLSNVLADPHLGLIFLVPGAGGTLRVNGTARIARDPWLLKSLAQGGKAPRLALVVTVAEVMVHCARCMARSGLWQPETWPDISNVPGVAEMVATHSGTSMTRARLEEGVAKALEKLY